MGLATNPIKPKRCISVSVRPPGGDLCRISPQISTENYLKVERVAVIGGLESTFSGNGKSYDVDPGSRISLVPCFGVILVDNIYAYYADSFLQNTC